MKAGVMRQVPDVMTDEVSKGGTNEVHGIQGPGWPAVCPELSWHAIGRRDAYSAAALSGRVCRPAAGNDPLHRRNECSFGVRRLAHRHCEAS